VAVKLLPTSSYLPLFSLHTSRPWQTQRRGKYPILILILFKSPSSFQAPTSILCPHSEKPRKLTPPTQHGNNTNQPARDPRRPLHRQCQRLRLLSRGSRAYPPLLPGDDLQVPVHGGEHPAPGPGSAREDPRYQKDAGDGAVPAAAQGGKYPPRLLLMCNPEKKVIRGACFGNRNWTQKGNKYQFTNTHCSPTLTQTSRLTSNSMIPSTPGLRSRLLMPRRSTSGLERMSCWRTRSARRRPCWMRSSMLRSRA
jgi:hypothetical protein